MKRKDFQAVLALTMLSLLFAPSSAWATRMITGRILTPTGQPAAGLTVKAFDEDDGPDDPMGRTVTDAQGRYSIGQYDGQRWDTYVATTSWRPDIYVEVFDVIDGHEVAVGKSSTHEDHLLAHDLTIDLQLKGIIGTITDRGARRVGGILVKAFDEDDLSQDDFMNKVPTDANGVFVMPYEQKYGCQSVFSETSCWDTAVPASATWRPDVYVEVHGVVRGRQIKINNKSTTTSDVPHRDNVSIQESVPRLDDIDYTTLDPWTDNDVLHVLAYNVYLRPRILPFINGQATRLPHIVREILRDKYDVIVFSEVFDDDLRRQLRQELAASYPYHAKVPQTGDPTKNDGGVKILSKWPIENGENLKGEQLVFGLPCLGADCASEKGVVYVKINKNGTRYHIFGTHVQADEPPNIPPGMGTARQVRTSQFQRINNFIDDKNIPATEAVIIAGDLNVDMYASHDEYNEMLQTLNAAHPSPTGHPYSIDGSLNDLNEHGGAQKLLDYVLYSRGYRQPANRRFLAQRVKRQLQEEPLASNRVMFYRSDVRWREFDTERYRWDISDHYPVFGRFDFMANKFRTVPGLEPFEPPIWSPSRP